MKRRKNLHKAVIEIEEVEYLINEQAAKDIEEKKESITLMRLFDAQERVIVLDDLEKVLNTNIVDYLD